MQSAQDMLDKIDLQSLVGEVGEDGSVFSFDNILDRYRNDAGFAVGGKLENRPGIDRARMHFNGDVDSGECPDPAHDRHIFQCSLIFGIN